MTTKSTAIVRHDPAIASAALFHPLRKDKGPRPKLDLTQEFSGFTIRYRGPDQLSIDDQGVLLAIMAIAEKEGKELSSTTTGNYTKQVLDALLPAGCNHSVSTVYIDAHLYLILKTAGMSTDKRSYTQLRECIDRLASVTVFVDCYGDSMQMRLLSRVIKATGEIKIGLNERLAKAFLGGQYVKIDIAERQKLAGDVAKGLHAWLSAVMHQGNKLSCGIDKLAKRVYGEGKTTEGALRKRRHRVKEALGLINSLAGWTVDLCQKQEGPAAEITRHKKC